MNNSINKDQTTTEQGNFLHIVYFWLKNPNNESDRKSFENSLKKFINGSEFVQTKFVGIPATTNRTVIDNSYTYCLKLTFKNELEQNKYQIEPVHKKFIEESSNLWEKVLVYDSENIL